MTEIDKFYNSFKVEVSTVQKTEVKGETQEQAFTRVCIDMLSRAKETENAVIAYDIKGEGTKQQHQINGYALSAENDTIDLFISIFESSESIETLEKSKIDRAVTRISNFFKKAFLSRYDEEIAETSSIFEFANYLATSMELRQKLIRINAFILTNKKYSGDIPSPIDVDKYRMYFNIIDIEKLYSISEQSRLPIQIDFAEEKVIIPCMKVDVNADEYDAYMTFFPGHFLSSLYQRYGFKLLEQNVRAFLQFKNGINQGIKRTIIDSPKMFFAYNNGISATADSITFDEDGKFIKSIGNLQIVNGGQTTASLFHVTKEAKEQIKSVLVPVKISVIKTGNNYEVVKNISTYANTQTKVNQADLTASHPKLVEIEKLSRYMLTPITAQSDSQHYWFFDRIKKQYDNLVSQNSTLKSKKAAFERKYPKQCKFNSYQLAKFYNVFCEIVDNDKIVVGPHTVVDGNEPNFRVFKNYILDYLTIDSVFYEDLIAKAILFKDVDKRHGTKRDKVPPLGDMKQLTVPYSIALLNMATNGRLNLGKIWKQQCVSADLSDYMYNMMKVLYPFFKENSPKSNIIEWGTKEDCWRFVKENFSIPDISVIKDDLCTDAEYAQRYLVDKSESENISIAQEKLVKAIGTDLWESIAEWGKDSECLCLQDRDKAKNIAHKLRFDYNIARHEIKDAISIYEVVCRNNHELIDTISTNEPISTDTSQVSMLMAWSKIGMVLKVWQIKIIQDTMVEKKISNIRLQELNYILCILKDNGFDLIDKL